MKAILNCLFLTTLIYNQNIQASSDIAPQEMNLNALHANFLDTIQYFSPKEKLEFLRRIPQTTDLERQVKSMAHSALKDDIEVLFYLKIELDKTLR